MVIHSAIFNIIAEYRQQAKNQPVVRGTGGWMKAEMPAPFWLQRKDPATNSPGSGAFNVKDRFAHRVKTSTGTHIMKHPECRRVVSIFTLKGRSMGLSIGDLSTVLRSYGLPHSTRTVKAMLDDVKESRPERAFNTERVKFQSGWKLTFRDALTKLRKGGGGRMDSKVKFANTCRLVFLWIQFMLCYGVDAATAIEAISREEEPP